MGIHQDDSYQDECDLKVSVINEILDDDFHSWDFFRLDFFRLQFDQIFYQEAVLRTSDIDRRADDELHERKNDQGNGETFPEIILQEKDQVDREEDSNYAKANE